MNGKIKRSEGSLKTHLDCCWKLIGGKWFRRKGQITVFVGRQSYEQCSRFLFNLDLAVLERCLNYADQYDAVTDLSKAVRQGEV